MGSYGKLSEAAKKIAKASGAALAATAAVGAGLALTDDDEGERTEDE